MGDDSEFSDFLLNNEQLTHDEYYEEFMNFKEAYEQREPKTMNYIEYDFKHLNPPKS